MTAPKHTGATLFVGTSGYSYPDWKGVVYPRSLKRGVNGPAPELTYLSRYFNTCEINATFFRQFEPEIARRWSDAVESPAFEFAIKANQVFTHAAGGKPGARKASTSVETLRYTQADIDKSRKFLDVLAERNRLLVVLFQFPVSFNSDSRDERYDYLYSPEELGPIAQSRSSMANKVEHEPTHRQVKKVIATTNNHYKGQAAVNAIDIKRLLGTNDIEVPPELARAYPQLSRGATSEEEASRAHLTPPRPSEQKETKA